MEHCSSGEPPLVVTPCGSFPASEVDASAPFQSVEEAADDCAASDSSAEPPVETPGASFSAPPPPEESALGRAEVDTSAPFQSVKEAVDRFGGSAVWSLQLKQLLHPEEHNSSEDVDLIGVEEQAILLEKDLIMKERETLDVLKELEMTKKIVDGLKMKLQKETTEAAMMSTICSDNINLAQEHGRSAVEKFIDVDSARVGPNQSAGLILLELKQAKENLNRATNNLADIRESIELFNNKIEEEKHMLEATQEKLVSNVATLTSLEEEFNQATEKLHKTQYLESKSNGDPSIISQEIKQINAEMEQSRKVTEAAKHEVHRLIAEIEQTKTSIKTAEIRMLAAKKMEEAARAAEAVALAEINALVSSNSSASDLLSVSSVTLSTEEYVTLMRKAQEAEEASKRKIEVAMEEVNEANRYRTELLFKVEEANAEAKAYKSALEDALKRVEDANRGKLAVEEALRTWRSEQGQRRHNFRNTTKFKSSAHHRRDSHVLNLNGSSLITDPPSIGLHPPLSIGQILSMKLMVPGGNEWEKENEKPKVSLGQMLNKKPGHGDMASQQMKDESTHKTTAAKRKKLGFVGLSLVLAKQNKKNKKKRQSLDSSPASSFGKARQELEDRDNHLNFRC